MEALNMPYIWKQKGWPHFRRQSEQLINSLSRARFAQGNLLSKIHSLGLDLSQESRSEILIEEAVKTAAIEGVHLDKEAVRSFVARKLGLPTAGLRPPDRNAEGLVSVILDATVNYKKPLAAKRLKSWQAAVRTWKYRRQNDPKAYADTPSPSHYKCEARIYQDGTLVVCGQPASKIIAGGKFCCNHNQFSSKMEANQEYI